MAVANASFRTIALGEIDDRGPDLKALESLVVQVGRYVDWLFMCVCLDWDCVYVAAIQ